jgi:replication-associated recombination protein RarA
MDYIGQEKLIESLSKTNARAMLIQGPAHSGKKTLIRKLYKDLGLYVYEVSGTVSDFRETMEFIKTQTKPIMYLIPDVDRLHPGIQNLLLKILEEPPMRARFCLTASNSILPTIKSRCVCYTMEPYTPEQIQALLCDSERAVVQKYVGVISHAVTTPGQLYLLVGWANYSVLSDMIDQMLDIQSSITQPLAVVLNKANMLSRFMKENTVDFYMFYLLARGIHSDTVSYNILTQNLYELDRYIMCYFYAELWKEVACK